MKQVIAIILMVLAGNAWGIGGLGGYHLDRDDMRRIEAVVNQECGKFAAFHSSAAVAAVVENTCKLKANAIIYNRFDNILGSVNESGLKEALNHPGAKLPVAAAAVKHGVTLGEVIAAKYLGLGIE
ncbi:hypothetical protein [Escherichia coli]|uniref:hypothetical protein n=1 Tax=Escherichia coli TaxID=562 RepID=UPI00388E8A87|nr:hypothetical protein [Escherichia coli]